jgi:hypothetical protein
MAIWNGFSALRITSLVTPSYTLARFCNGLTESCYPKGEAIILVTIMLMKKITSVGLLGIALSLNLAGVAEAKEHQLCEWKIRLGPVKKRIFILSAPNPNFCLLRWPKS